MLGNPVDAQDLAAVGANTWRHNACRTADPPTLCAP
jgi:hypothetical protein